MTEVNDRTTEELCLGSGMPLAEDLFGWLVCPEFPCAATCFDAAGEHMLVHNPVVPDVPQ
jgi:hypothetical protein